MNRLLFALAFLAVDITHAAIQVKDLGLKLNYSSNLWIDKFNPSFAQSTVGYCDGDRFHDYASLEGCDRAAQAKKMYLMPSNSAIIGAFTTNSLSLDSYPKLKLPVSSVAEKISKGF